MRLAQYGHGDGESAKVSELWLLWTMWVEKNSVRTFRLDLPHHERDKIEGVFSQARTSVGPVLV